MPALSDALTTDRDGTILTIEVSAGARTDLFPAGYNEWRRAVGCRVSAPAVGGKANRAVLELISSTLDVPISAVTLVSGVTSSQKKIRISGITREQLTGVLSARLG
ncbi:MAG: DUF167 domain-containing protein [Methanoregula sp.]